MDYGKKFFKSAKFRFSLLGCVGLTALSLGLKDINLTDSTYAPAQKEAIVPPIKDPIQSVSFVNDTLDTYASALMTYSNNKIVRNLVKNSYQHRMQLPYFVHEWWHCHNKKIAYWRTLKYSPAQLIQIKMHEEISANVIAIATADLEYQLADNKDAVIKKYENTYMGFYFDAIKNGTIKPESTDTIERNKKFSLLINGAIQMWEQKFRQHYTPSLLFSLKQYLRNYGYFKQNNKNYQKVLSHMYTIGHVDLSKYIIKDVTFPDIKINIFNDLANVRSLQGDKKFREILINNLCAYADKLPYYPAHQRKTILQHILIASKVKYELKALDNFALKPNTEAISCAYDKVCFQFSRDKSFINFINICDYIEKISVPFGNQKSSVHIFDVSSHLDESRYEDIAQFYNFRHIDLTKLIAHFDVNRLPTDDNKFLEFGTCYFAHPSMSKLIIPISKDDPYYALNDTENSGISDAVISENSSKNHDNSKFGKHLSKKLFVNIPNFEEALLNPQALTPDVRLKLKNLFQEFNDIPTEFKECNIQKSQKYIQLHGDPHYFEHKESPFQAHFTRSHKSQHTINLITLRRIKQQNSNSKQ